MDMVKWGPSLPTLSKSPGWDIKGSCLQGPLHLPCPWPQIREYLGAFNHPLLLISLPSFFWSACPGIFLN